VVHPKIEEEKSMKPIYNERRNNVSVYISRSQYHGYIKVKLNGANNTGLWVILEPEDLKEILDRLPLKAVHERRCRYKRLKLEVENGATSVG
jgi:hypothetical protein